MWTELKSFSELLDYMEQGYVHFRLSDGDTRARTVAMKDVVAVSFEDTETLISELVWNEMIKNPEFRPLILLKKPKA